MTDSNERTLNRRTLLKRSAGALPLGLGGLAARQDEEDGEEQEGGAQGGRPLYARRFVFPFPERLGTQDEPEERYDPTDDLLQQIIIVTDRKDTRPDELGDVDQNEVDGCNFGEEWPPENLAVWESVIVRWKNTLQIFGSFEASPTVQATQLIEVNNVFASPNPNPIPLGTPFIINGVEKCPGDLVGVTAQKIPGVQIATGPGESTGESSPAE